VIKSELRGQIGIIEIDRPERRNALDLDHCHALRDCVGKAVAGGARTLVITGVGTSFCAGADLGTVYGPGFRDALREVLSSIAQAPLPVIAAVNGPAVGAGTQLAIACDLRVAAEGAVFAIPTAQLGLAVDPWTVRRLAAVAGAGTARALLLACETLSAERAYGMGFVDRLGDRDAALRWAEEVGALAPLTQAYSKRALDAAVEGVGVDAEAAAGYEAVWRSEDAQEGRRARVEKRRPRFRGR
jgi:enoyl-CoA hydratase